MVETQKRFELVSDMRPRGDQIRAITELTEAFARGEKQQTLLGVTGSGKTFTVANVIARLGVPTLVIAHNKTLAAQLHAELAELFPQNAVEYFVSYYDYYQPEAYVPSTDTYIAKDASINEAIDRMRHAATRSLFERKDVIIVASVSCIYGIGSVEAYGDMLLTVRRGEQVSREHVLARLIAIQFERNDVDFHRGTFRVRGDVVEVFPAHELEHALRLEWFGDELEAISLIDPLRGQKLEALEEISIYPATHYVVSPVSQRLALASIRRELDERLVELRAEQKLVEAQRLEERTRFDLEMLETMGRCNGIENYSRHLTGRAPGQPPPTLVDYMRGDFLLIIDESHQSVPQLGAMYRGDRARKETLVRFGFRLPSAIDNRPLKFDELERMMDRVIYVSATPGGYELARSLGVVVEQIIRPTGLIDPEVVVKPVTNQVDDLLAEIRTVVARKFRVLVTTLTKRMAEDLTEYLGDAGVRVRYLHSDIGTLERIEILRDLRLGVFDVLVGINLLREGLDLPEVALVAILDADKEGFLRSTSSLIQTIGRAARNVEGRVILYADKMTASITTALDETNRRRLKQLAYNTEHGITPTTVQKPVRDLRVIEEEEAPVSLPTLKKAEDLPKVIDHLKQEMAAAAAALEYERAAELRDLVRDLEQQYLRLA